MVDEWAQTSIVVFDPAGLAVETIDMLGATLSEQLAAAEEWLRERESAREVTPTDKSSVRLYSSWAAADGQHAMTLSPTLIAALAGAQGVFWMDVYPAEDD